MNLIFDAILGFVISFIGVALPGLINMTAVKVVLEKGLNRAFRFCLGACLTIFFQAWVAVAFATYLSKHEEVVAFLKGISVLVFIILAVVFYFQAIKPKAPSQDTKEGKPILLGMAIAAMNFLNVPFYLSAGTLLESEGYITIYFPIYFFFIGGLVLGSGAALLLYVYSAKWIAANAQFFARHLNYFLSGLFLLLAVFQIIQMNA
ncbi:MAG: lysine transporter LysE [Saprospiraceae bacterium]